MKFRDDIDLGRTWLISDTHFGHKNIIGYCHRPENFEDILLEEINAVVRPGDTLLHLGDLCYKGNSWFKNVIAPKIAPGARKLLILGNHDRQRQSFYRQTEWHVCRPFYLPIAPSNDRCIVASPEYGSYEWVVSFSHYQWSPESSDGKLSGEFGEMSPNHRRIHGHIHNNGYFDGRSFSPPRWDLIPVLLNHFNASCEMTKYKPVNLQLLLDAWLLGVIPRGPHASYQSDGESPTRSDLGGENPHA